MKRLENTVIRIALVALLWLITVNAGDLGTLDTDLRLQMSHAWATNTPEVIITPEMTPKVRGDIRYGVIGRDGNRYIGYETGQSFLMLPADWLGTQLHRLWSTVPEDALRRWVINAFVFIPINLGIVLATFWLLRLFQFEEKVAGIASLSLLLGTTVLHYTQVQQHNSQLLALCLVGYATAVAYLQSKRNLWLVIGGMALGMAVFIRVTSMIHALTVALFLAGALAYENRKLGLSVALQIRSLIQSGSLWLAGFIPVFLLSRYVDFLRYGSFLASGKSVEKDQLATDPIWTGLPQLPDNYPLINSPLTGILGPFISPAKSLFLYDPLLIPCLILCALGWRKFSPWLRWYLVTAVLNLGLHLAAYSRFVFWHGDAAWAARYHVTSVHLLMVPLLACFIQQLLSARQWRRRLLRAILAIAVMVQLASVAMPMNLEITQKQVGTPGSRLDARLPQRLSNLACYVAPTLTKLCIERLPDKKKYLERYNHLQFFPFVFAQTRLTLDPASRASTMGVQISLFVLWGLALVAAVALSFNTWRWVGL
jgi:hypothetical protein